MYKEVENIIGYKFHNKKLLEQAFTRSSYANEKNIPSNEVLEFVGDKVIDFVVVATLAKKYGTFPCEQGYYKTTKQEGDLTNLKSQIVCSETLSAMFQGRGLDEYIRYGKNDLYNMVDREDSVKEDAFEALIGAIAIDSEWDFSKIAPVVEDLLCLDEYLRKTEIMMNYTGLVQELASKNGLGQPYYKLIQKKKDNTMVWQAILEIDGIIKKTKGFGQSQKEAKKEAAYKMIEEIHLYEAAKGHNNIQNNEVFDTINHLVQSNVIQKPEYYYEEDFDENGNPIWSCVTKTEHGCFVGYGSTKKEAQRESLTRLLNKF